MIDFEKNNMVYVEYFEFQIHHYGYVDTANLNKYL